MFDAKQLRMAELKASRDAAKELSASRRRRNAAWGKKNDHKAKLPKNNHKPELRKQGDEKPLPKAEDSPRSRRPSEDSRRVSIPTHCLRKFRSI